MIRRKSAAVETLLVVVVGLSIFACSHGSQGAAVQSQKSGYLPIRLAVGTLDPLSESDRMALPNEWTLNRYPKDEAGYYILQFKGPVLEAWKGAVFSAGVRLFDYIPQFAYIAKMTQATRRKIQAMDSVRWIGIYQPGFRVAPDLRTSIPGRGDQPVVVIVSLFPGEGSPHLPSEINRLGGEILEASKTNDRLRLRIPAKRIPGLSRLGGVKWIDKVPEFKLSPTPSKRSEE
jgi:hypothetical protein